ncbi:MAG: PDZ domain-containing protein [Bryobacteraceae bacterium]
MNKFFGLTIVFFAATIAQSALAQGPDFFQAPAPPPVREFNGAAFVGGTYLGVNLAEIDANRAKELKLKEDYGVEISRVEENSPAEKAGVKAGDVVLEYNGQRVEGMEQFGRMVRETPPGREVKLTISRNGATQTLLAVLGSRKYRFSGNFPPGFEVPEFHMPDIPQIFTTIRSPMLGVEAESLGTQLGVYFGVKDGVLVRSVLDNTPAQKAGIKAGDVITKVDGMAVSAPSELSNAVRAASAKKTYAIELVRDRKPVTVSVNVEDRSGSERWIPRGRTVQNSVTN